MDRLEENNRVYITRHEAADRLERGLPVRYCQRWGYYYERPVLAA